MNKTQTLNYYKVILNKYQAWTKLDEHDNKEVEKLLFNGVYPDLVNLLSEGYSGQIMVTIRSQWKSKGFSIITANGNLRTFSYLKCIKVWDSKLKFNLACRQAINNDIFNFKINKTDTFKDIDVHHYIITFKTIVENFILKYNIDINTIEYIIYHGCRFKDDKLAEKFRKYHKQRAILKIINRNIHRKLKKEHKK